MKLETPQAVEAASPAPIPGMNPRTRMLLQAPIASTLVKLAWPNLLVMLAQASTGLIETWWVSHLGTDALTGMAVVFPGFMMMQMLSAGAMGGGISSAIARALGARRVDDAEALVLHATVINILLGLIGSAIFLIWGRAIYTAMGVSGGALDAAMQYSNVVFGGSVLVWLMNGFASIIRGTGNMLVPSLSICIGVVILIPLSPLLIFGWGPIPALGIAGGGWAVVLSTFVVGAVLAGYILAGRCIVHFKWARLRWDLSADILRVGAIAAVISLQTSFTVLLTTALVGSFAGGDAVAGFGTGVRLEYLMVPLAFGFGGPLVALVGTNIGAGQQDRALRAALIGGGMVFVITETIGLAAAIWPAAWLGLFGSDPQMIETGSAYLRIVGPAYGFFGLGLSLYFASQGAGKMLYPLLAGVLRLLISIVGGWLALRLTGSLTWLFACLAFALVVYGSIIVTAVATGTWFKPKTS
ncbi:MAG: MATE family efflux transporter [Hyphomicrobiales bacterium]|nr:MATE family efflux transporter [Hyphomicrobiales bacterium]